MMVGFTWGGAAILEAIRLIAQIEDRKSMAIECSFDWLDREPRTSDKWH
jgi:hypothetical protein